MRLQTPATPALWVLIMLIINAIIGLFGGCESMHVEAADSQPVTLEVIAVQRIGETQEFVSAFSGMVRHYRYETDCPDMAVIKVQATNSLEESMIWDGIRALSMPVIFTDDGKRFAVVTPDFSKTSESTGWERLTFVALCQHLENGKVLLTERQHYIQFE